MPLYNPPHPGETIGDFCIKPLGVSVTEVAEGLGVSRKALSELLNGHSGISPEMAIRISRVFGGSPESWMRQQMQYDLWEAGKKLRRVNIRSFVATNIDAGL